MILYKYKKMYVYQVSSSDSDELKVITGKTVSDICGEILFYNNETNKNTNIDYDVTFFNFKGDEILTISEDALKYAIFGADSNDVSDNIKEYSQKYWEMNHTTIEIIGFNNPCHLGEVMWDPEYNEETDNSDDDLVCDNSSENYNSNQNIITAMDK